MELGVFIPIGNNGWLISTTSPQYKPSFDLNLEVVRKAERFGFDFALSMIKLHGFGGPSQFWDYNLESFTLMAGLAAATSRIQLFATCAVLTLPPPIAARMAVTIDSISHGRFGINIISGWQRREYTQMGIWPGAEHYRRRYEYCAEYVTIMRQLWESGRSDFKGDFFQMDDCRCLPLPTAKIPIICAAQSDAGTPLRGATRRLQFLHWWRGQSAECGDAERRTPGGGDGRERARLRRVDPSDGHRRRDRCGGDGEMGALQSRHRPPGLGLARRTGRGRSEQGPVLPAEPAQNPRGQPFADQPGCACRLLRVGRADA
jgi:alkanesulfonate monooxygenase SsuD/methylene tetrahydromethanopterin reductase-like flavin-dependent oxidoreductase (luciferase family)